VKSQANCIPGESHPRRIASQANRIPGESRPTRTRTTYLSHLGHDSSGMQLAVIEVLLQISLSDASFFEDLQHFKDIVVEMLGRNLLANQQRFTPWLSTIPAMRLPEKPKGIKRKESSSSPPPSKKQKLGNDAKKKRSPTCASGLSTKRN